MDRASSLIFPGGKTLVGWWRQLAPRQPLGFWVGYVFLHRIEAPVTVRCEQPIDPLTHHFLQALKIEPTDTGLQARLQLPVPVMRHVLGEMQGAGLVTRPTPETWHTTDVGHHALEHRCMPGRTRQRRVFTFFENVSASDERAPAHFVPIEECTHADWHVDDAHRFDVAWLHAGIGQPEDWKRARGFPLDVEALANGPSDDGQHVIVDRPERVLLALVAVGAELFGFAVKVDGWTLFDRQPVLRQPMLECTWLPAEPAPSVWQETWRNWCRQRQLPSTEVESCTVTYRPPRLEVQAPGRLVQRLQAARSDLFKGEAWLLVGDGYLRPAVQLAARV
jgi:hypothetical protein